jgi:type I restriction enzyme S subunit
MSVENLITEHLDIWTSAIKTKSAAGRGSSKKLELVGVKKLRELILELAVRGKLVPQDPNDEPASELLKKIEAEKNQLIKAGKIKKQKSLAPITDEEKPFELSDGWEWVKLGEITVLENGDRSKRYPNESDLQADGVPFFGAKEMVDNVLQINEGLRFITPQKFSELSNGKLKDKDFVILLRGYVGKIAQFRATDEYSTGFINAQMLIIRLIEKSLSEYFRIFSKSLFFQNAVASKVTGSAVSQMPASEILKFLVPMPPIEEQYGIVAKVDELMVLCDQLEAQTEASIDAHKTLVEVLLATLTDAKDAIELNDNWQTVSQYFDVLFTTQASIDQLKQTILQLAVMGKLVKQDPNDEHASKLLERIATEKLQLIKDGKIKKQKPLPPITDEEKTFELPNSWECERIGTFGIVGTGSTPSRSNPDYWEPPEFNWVSSGETSDFFVSATKEKVSALAIKETNVSLYPAGTLIVAMYGQGKTRGQITELLSEAGTNQACAAIRLVNNAKHHKNYVKLYFRKAYAELRSHAAGGAQPNLNVGKISNTVLALPPLAEQHRIVAKVDQLMALCDSLKANLNQAQTTQLHLTDAIVEQAL